MHSVPAVELLSTLDDEHAITNGHLSTTPHFRNDVASHTSSATHPHRLATLAQQLQGSPASGPALVDLCYATAGLAAASSLATPGSEQEQRPRTSRRPHQCHTRTLRPDRAGSVAESKHMRAARAASKVARSPSRCPRQRHPHNCVPAVALLGIQTDRRLANHSMRLATHRTPRAPRTRKREGRARLKPQTHRAADREGPPGSSQCHCTSAAIVPAIGPIYVAVGR
ncbi:hypothetical protein L227DRAFT_386241 [Lentinus tigrinus ALCF2SS1-6]|uniref:Uncharacterized protein n=1 Tax=Lentinus tigrinus ALCF2SS1-6 TaxID=1328759 RepID=A0A5C2SPB7_9APHY|nr:hypothetical protein L227DRAFT_386241 [Lentinus tigrinus ALCF2SS1-6]